MAVLAPRVQTFGAFFWRFRVPALGAEYLLSSSLCASSRTHTHTSRRTRVRAPRLQRSRRQKMRLSLLDLAGFRARHVHVACVFP
jgi:hypothetical protein